MSSILVSCSILIHAPPLCTHTSICAPKSYREVYKSSKFADRIPEMAPTTEKEGGSPAKKVFQIIKVSIDSHLGDV